MKKMMQRGQAFLETAFFLPILLLTMIAIIYFNAYGVLQDRAVEAVRYASLVENGGVSSNGTVSKDGNTYPAVDSLEAMYAEMAREGSSPNPAPPPAVSGDSCTAPTASENGGAVQQASEALYQEESGLGLNPSPAPSFFESDTTPVPTCTELVVLLRSPGTAAVDTVADSYFTVQLTSISANKVTPVLLRLTPGAGPTPNPVYAQTGYAMAPNPAMM
ncbi:MAG TPA: hypothetical protein VME66_03635, partial [Candidatus Acidoferrales bacterium]|nr:hypothetical protein [Candidatus Acidoferrales bacterium]